MPAKGKKVSKPVVKKAASKAQKKPTKALVNKASNKSLKGSKSLKRVAVKSKSKEVKMAKSTKPAKPAVKKPLPKSAAKAKPVSKTAKAAPAIKATAKSGTKPAAGKAKKSTAVSKPVPEAKKNNPAASTQATPAKKITTPMAKPATISKPVPAAKASAPVKPKAKTAANMGSPITNMSTMGVPPYEAKANEEYMNERQREHFRKILELWKQELMEEVDRTVHHMQDDAANFPDPNDRATQEEEFSLELRTRDRERKLIKKIEEALQKLENEEYGYCDACGIEIGIRRLEARPTANLCIDCKTLDEIREKQMA